MGTEAKKCKLKLFPPMSLSVICSLLSFPPLTLYKFYPASTQRCLTSSYLKHSALLTLSFYLITILSLCSFPVRLSEHIFSLSLSCTGSSLLCAGLFQFWRVEATLQLQASHCGDFSRCGAQAPGHVSFSSCSTQAQQQQRMGLAALLNVGSSQTGDWTSVPCFARQILNY